MWPAPSYPIPGGKRSAFQKPTTTTNAQMPASAKLARRLPATRLALVRPPEERARRAQQDLQVEERRAVLDVPEVELDPLRPREAGATVHLRPAGDAGLDVEPAPLPLVVLLDLVPERRARSDQRHVAADDVPELRQLVDREAPEETPDRRDPRVAAVDRPPRPDLLGAD